MSDIYEKALKGYYKWQIVNGRNYPSGHGIILTVGKPEPQR